ncbi:MAG TPA: ComEC/Rec2 family competence protein [Alphaproteobacteria bacterium]|nr:ComEC/Rec2 family competence protein [Alphaproteobacteria bacterium]
MSGGAAWSDGPAERTAHFWLRLAWRLAAAITAQLAEERERWLLWLPVLLACGIGLYFGLHSEPPLWAGPAAVAGLIAATALLRRRPAVALTLLVLSVIAIGLTLVQWRAAYVAAPVLERRHGPIDVEGRVVALEIRPDGRRIILDRLTIAGLAAQRTPATVRVRVREAPGIQAGDRIAVKAVLQPPPPPSAPGSYDFQRQAWFERLGAVGYAVGAITRVDAQAEASGWRVRLNRTRQNVVERVLEAIPGAGGAVAAALLTGEQGAVPVEVMEWMRDSGLAHLLSVSGLHVGLVATIVFLIIRQSLALVPRIALRWPIKKWAAVGAFIAITMYMLFVAPGVPTQRSWLMTSVVLFATLIDRTAISMRLVAWAALAVLVMAPESLLGPSFQMSFAAVVALIAAWEASRARFTAWRIGSGYLRRAAISLLALGMTSLVAGLATAPYALYHFNRFAAYGLVANLIAVPLTGIWVMPWAILVFVLLPFGLESWALVPMGWGCDAIIAIAREVAGWDGSSGLWPAMPVWGLVAITIGGVWLCLWQRRWRLAGLPLIAAGMASAALERGPDILVSGDARLIAVRGADGLLQMSTERSARLVRETWLRRSGQADAPAVWPRSGRSVDGLLSCDAASCLYRARGYIAAFAHDPSALTEDCHNVDVLIATFPVRRRCPSADVVIDRIALWRDGGHVLWLEDGNIRVESVRASRGERPWVAAALPRNRDGEGRQRADAGSRKAGAANARPARTAD